MVDVISDVVRIRVIEDRMEKGERNWGCFRDGIDRIWLFIRCGKCRR